jgi:DNA-binding protein Fis
MEELLAAQIRGGRRLRLPKQRAPELGSVIERLVRLSLENASGNGDITLYDRLVRGVERELIEQVLRECDGVQIKAAARLGINRNTLHKKLEFFGLAEDEAKDHPPDDDY